MAMARQSRTRRAARGKSKPRGETIRHMYDKGMAEGYRAGLDSGFSGFHNTFDGTSIIIPNYNQVEFLRQCVESIFQHTDESYEIIVVDNASTDGSADYLRRLGVRIRYRLLDRNSGFAGAINRGLVMAKGSTIMLLNNDTLVTPGWLRNMLACLRSDERIGMVGPVTNYISGDQRIDVPYKKTEDMYAFAREFNRSDPAKWQRTDRLTGFCLLFRRELLERTGFLDEGYQFGNYEDDDYNIRVRLQGRQLAVARDTFIHHFGSVSMKALGDRFEPVNRDNEQYFLDKWGNPYGLLHHVTQNLRGPDARSFVSETDYYPQFVAVKGVGDTVFLVAHGERRPVEGDLSVPVVRLPQIDMQRWPIGAAIEAGEAEAVWRGAQAEARLASASDGRLYYIEEGRRRLVASGEAARAWGLQGKQQAQLNDDELLAVPEGLPIIAPVRMRQVL